VPEEGAVLWVMHGSRVFRPARFGKLFELIQGL
jgi:hypothetical protein